MSDSNDGFDFCVSLPAEDWANTKRRMAFLEAILTQVMRDHTQIREWFTAQEIAALKLPSLSQTSEGIARKAITRNPHRNGCCHSCASLKAIA